MFAGAAREAVFSNADVIRRIRADFVPIALEAGLINAPPDDDEGRLYREISRSKAAPQGICVVNSAGKVLVWTLMFDDDNCVLAFLDHALGRFAKHPDADHPFAAERYRSFPSQRLDDRADSGKVPPVPDRHAEGKACPAKPRIPRGTVVARLFGRALDADGNPLTDTTSQENYVEDRFEVSVAMQQTLATELGDAGGERFALPGELARLLASHAFLGQLDLNPLGGMAGGRGARNELKQCQFWAQDAGPGRGGSVLVHIEGESNAMGKSGDDPMGDGRIWRHQVELAWEGCIELKGNRMTRLLLVARGSEKLKWANALQELHERASVTQLPAGHAIDLDCGVRYGIVGEPVAAEDAWDGDDAGTLDGLAPFPSAMRRQLAAMLGGEFAIFRDRVQDEVKLSDSQRQKVMDQFGPHFQTTMRLFERIKDLPPEEREREVNQHRQKSGEALAAELKGILNDDQQRRLFQLQLQQAGAFALAGQNEAFRTLKISDEQRRCFTAVVPSMHEKMQPLLVEAQASGGPDEIAPKLLRVRREHAGRILAILSRHQKEQWQALLGRAFEFDD